MSFLKDFVKNYDWVMTEKNDPRTREWFLISSPWPTIICVSVYVAFVYGGQSWMKKRPAFGLKDLLMVYNFCLVLLNAYIFYEFMVSAVFNPEFSLICQPMDYSYDPMSIRLAKVCWLFYFSKIIELLDTVFFVLRKKNNQISFLHVYHHTTMPLLWWIGIRFVPGGEAYFSAAINSFIHILMYTYYLLSAMGPHMQKYLWWKKYMTTLQLIQFWMIMFHTSYAIYTDCGFPKEYMYTLIAYTLSHILLFSNFYYHTYTKKARMKREQEVTSNGKISQNTQGDHELRNGKSYGNTDGSNSVMSNGAVINSKRRVVRRD